MDVVVFGAGYVGLVTGTVLAVLGHHVTLVEINPEKVEKVQNGEPPIYEPGLELLLKRVRESDTLHATRQGKEPVFDADVVFIAVGTPPAENGDADLTALQQAAVTIGRGLNPSKKQVIVNKATVPIGSANLVEVWIQDGYRQEYSSEPRLGSYAVASNPEFLREGSAIYDTLYPDRIVLGADDRWALDTLTHLYRPLIQQQFDPPEEIRRPRHLTVPVPLIITDRISSEMVKYAANAFLATKISFANEIANICERVGADVNEVMRGVGLDNRIGNKFLKAGVGWGGSCFGKDLHALAYTAEEYGYDPVLLKATARVNTQQRHLLVKRVQSELKTLKGKKLAIWGLSFKPRTDDLRDAPSLTIIQELIQLGARIRAYDPVAMSKNQLQYPDLPVDYASSALDALVGADALVVITEWEEFSDIPLEAIRQRLAQPIVIDGRNIWSPLAAQEAGLIYRSIGR